MLVVTQYISCMIFCFAFTNPRIRHYISVSKKCYKSALWWMFSEGQQCGEYERKAASFCQHLSTLATGNLEKIFKKTGKIHHGFDLF